MLLLYVFTVLPIYLLTETAEINKWLISSSFLALTGVIYFGAKWKNER